ncbi:MAG: ribose-5-phosphate isomerase RpiA [Myxococcales bacterium]|nr:ribose-5-phosphate isomerase RpiA [Myxococcales bacterium]MCB9648767.1 ribose-5-phosphate isomerase RpiA [Deltaproteobacteria bacterium]
MSARDPATEKRLAAEAALGFVQPGMWLGLGSGSTAELMVHALGAQVQEGLQIAGAVPTSARTREIAASYGIPLCTLDDVDELDLVIDGADEADPELNLIKGGGGQLLHEKIVAAASRQMVVIADSSKVVSVLGAFKLPVEIIEAARRPLIRQIGELGGEPTLRQSGGGAYRTLEGNLILDCDFGPIEEPAGLARALADLPGVVEHGLFVGMADVLLVGRDGGVDVIRAPERSPSES